MKKLKIDQNILALIIALALVAAGLIGYELGRNSVQNRTGCSGGLPLTNPTGPIYNCPMIPFQGPVTQ